MDTVPLTPKISVKTSRIRQFFRKDYSHIDSVNSSLENLVFSNWREEQKAIHKKRFFIGIISFILLTGFTVVISPKSKAEVATFYPTSCLGGWSNPHKAEGKPETSDGITSFNLNNSALLSSESIADLYCGSFKGEVPTSTTPTKMILTIVWNNLPNEDSKPIVSDSFASSTLNILDATSSVDFTLISSSSSTSTTESSTDILTSTTTDTTNNEEQHTEVSSSSTEAIIIESGTSDANSTQNESTINNILETSTENAPQTESIPQIIETKTEETKEPTPTTSTDTSSPQSYLYKLGQKIIASLISSVYALDDSMISSSSSTEINDQNNIITNTNTSTETENASDSSTSLDNSVTSPITETTTVTESTPTTETPNNINETSSTTTTESSSTTNDTATTTDPSISESTSTESSNPVFEIFYTLNGNDWVSLGKVNINNFSFNKFEIPLATSSNWSDISNIQIKIESLNTLDKKLPVFVDGMIIDVNYDKNVNAYEENADPKSYDITINSANGDLDTSVINDPSQGNILNVQSKTGGSLSVYKENNDNSVYNSGLGGDPLLINSYIFDTGNYTIVLTNKEDGCSGLSANDCVKAEGFVGSASFTVNPTVNTPLEYVHIK